MEIGTQYPPESKEFVKPILGRRWNVVAFAGADQRKDIVMSITGPCDASMLLNTRVDQLPSLSEFPVGFLTALIADLISAGKKATVTIAGSGLYVSWV